LDSYIPGETVVLSLFLAVIGTLGIFCGIFFFSQPIPPDVSIYLERSWLYAWVYSYYFRTGYYPIDLFSLAGIGISYTERLGYALFQRILAWGGLLLGLVGVLSGVGLFMAKRWGRYLTLMLGTILVVFGLVLVSMSLFGKIPLLTIMVSLTFSVMGALLVAYMLGQLPMNKFMGLSLRLNKMFKSRDVWLADCSPAPNVQGSDVVCEPNESAVATLETLPPSVQFGGKPTFWTRSARVSWIHESDGDAGEFSLVFDELSELAEAPGVLGATLGLSNRYPGADALQIF